MPSHDGIAVIIPYASQPLCSLRTADVFPRSSPLRDVFREEEVSPRETSLSGDERRETSAVRRLSFVSPRNRPPVTSSNVSLHETTSVKNGHAEVQAATTNLYIS